MNELDYDLILNNLKKKHGWGDGIDNNIEDFESSTYYSGTMVNDVYEEEFQQYLNDYQFGFIENEEEE